MPPTRPLILTRELVGRVNVPLTQPEWPEEIRRHTDEEIAAYVCKALASHDRERDVPVFAFGSLLWNLGFKAEEACPATARGWHRAFRMRLVIHRGTPERPGLMMGLDRGGTCRGVLFTVASTDAERELHLLFKREMPTRRASGVTVHMPRWITVETPSGPQRAIAFVINPKGPIYTGPLSLQQTADMLATGAGTGGSCAEYLFETVTKLVERGIYDRNLMVLQAMVADRLSLAANVTEGAVLAGGPLLPET